jgi:hypothetical protein
MADTLACGGLRHRRPFLIFELGYFVAGLRFQVSSGGRASDRINTHATAATITFCILLALSIALQHLITM